MKFDSHTQAILLLTSYFGDVTGQHRPLTAREWGIFATWLSAHKLKPEMLFDESLPKLLANWQDKKITLPRIEALLNRGSALALAAEKWERSGIWVLTRSNPEYPKALKKHLGASSPPVLFGCGKQSLLSIPAIAVVGSRKASETELTYTHNLGKAIASAGKSVVSGGAKGVDEASMLGSLESEGTCIGVMADSLLRQSTSAKYRKHLMDGNLVLISTVHPEAGFSVGNAMQRNKFIYGLSQAAIVVHSGTSGGTWEGANEILKKGWVPLWVKASDKTAEGNQALIDAGGRTLLGEPEQLDIDALCVGTEQPAQTLTLFCADNSVTQEAFAKDPSEPDSVKAEPKDLAEAKTKAAPELTSIQATTFEDGYLPSGPAQQAAEAPKQVKSLYEAFVLLAEKECQEAQTAEELASKLDVSKTQVNTWLKRAVDEDYLVKLTRPIRYQWQKQAQDDLFGKGQLKE